MGDIEFAVENVSYNINDIITVYMDAEDDDAYDLWDEKSISMMKTRTYWQDMNTM